MKRLTNADIDSGCSLYGYTRLDDYEIPKLNKIKFKCKNNHIIIAKPSQIINGYHGCVYCSNKNKMTPEKLDSRLLEFGIPFIRISDIFTENNTKKVQVQCKNNELHKFTFNIGSIKKSLKCEYCKNKNSFYVQKENYIQTLSEKNPTINILNNPFTDKISIFCCTICSYKWETKSHRDVVIGRSGCPKCSNVSRLTNEEVDSRLLARNSTSVRIGNVINCNNKIQFLCKLCNNHWHAPPATLVYAQGSDCPKCFKTKTSKYENALHDTCLSIFPNTIRHYIIKNIKIKNKDGIVIRNKIEVDFYIEHNNKKYLIEYNGLHHYKPVRYRKMTNEQAYIKYQNQIIRDQWLRDYCKNNNVVLIEIDGRLSKSKIKTAIYLTTILNKIKIGDL